jgi:hypothetical protein
VRGAQVNAGEPVRWFGVTERALIGMWLQWVAVLALVLLRAQRTVASRPLAAQPGVAPMWMSAVAGRSHRILGTRA